MEGRKELTKTKGKANKRLTRQISARKMVREEEREGRTEED